MISIRKTPIEYDLADEGKFSEIFELFEGDINPRAKAMLLKIPKSLPDKDKDKELQRFVSDRVKGTLLAALVARLWRLKGAYLQKRKPDLVIP